MLTEQIIKSRLEETNHSLKNYCYNCRTHGEGIKSVCDECVKAQLRFCKFCGSLKHVSLFHKKPGGILGVNCKCMGCNASSRKSAEGKLTEQEKLLEKNNVPKDLWASIIRDYTISEIKNGTGTGKNFKPKDLFTFNF